METKGKAVVAEARGQRPAWRRRRQLGKSVALVALAAWGRCRCRQQQRGGGSAQVAAHRWQRTGGGGQLGGGGSKAEARLWRQHK